MMGTICSLSLTQDGSHDTKQPGYMKNLQVRQLTNVMLNKGR